MFETAKNIIIYLAIEIHNNSWTFSSQNEDTSTGSPNFSGVVPPPCGELYGYSSEEPNQNSASGGFQEPSCYSSGAPAYRGGMIQTNVKLNSKGQPRQRQEKLYIKDFPNQEAYESAKKKMVSHYGVDWRALYLMLIHGKLIVLFMEWCKLEK